MSYQVLSRKWRPQQFADVLGQDHVVRTLVNALKRNRVAHAYIFTGPRGVGKTTTARILAKTLNCRNLKDAAPCNSCSSCQEITRGNNLDVLEIDGASNRGIDEIRELREAVKYPPTSGQYRIYIIDEVHMLTTQAFNALLKTLEEPPAQVVFILATTDVQKIPQTILSRTQRFDFRRVTIADIGALLGKILDDEKIAHTPGALKLLARKADGSIRDGLSLLDQVIAYQTEQIDEKSVSEVLGLVDEAFYYAVATAIANHNLSAILEQVEETFDQGYDLQEVAQGFNIFLRDALVSRETEGGALTSKGVPVEAPADLSSADLMALLQIGLETEAQLRYARQPRVLLEHQWLKMASLDRAVSIAKLLGEFGSAKPEGPKPGAVQSRRSPEARTDNPAPRDSAATAPAPALKETGPPAKTERKSAALPTGTAQQPGRSFRRQNQPEGQINGGAVAEPVTLDADVEQVKSRWEAILAAVEHKSAAIAAILEGAEVSGLENGRLALHLRAVQTIHLEILMDKKKLVEGIIEEITGYKLNLVPTIPESAAPAGENSNPDESTDEGISRLIETFNGEDY